MKTVLNLVTGGTIMKYISLAVTNHFVTADSTANKKI